MQRPGFCAYSEFIISIYSTKGRQTPSFSARNNPLQQWITKYFRIQTVYANYGCLLFKKSQNEFLENLANTVDLTLELRNHERNLQQVNEELLEIKAGLEITVQERTKELTLQNTELERWGHIFEHAEWDVIVCSADGLTIKLMNPAFASLYASTIAELKGQSLLGLFDPEVRVEVPGNFRLANDAWQRKTCSQLTSIHDVAT